MSIGRYKTLHFFLFLLAMLFASACADAADGETTADPVAQCTVLLELHFAEVEAQEEAGKEAHSDMTIWQQPIAELCPVQVEQLQQHRFAELLARPVGELLLVDLQGFYQAVDELAEARKPSVLDEAVLQHVLDELGAPPEEPVSLWQRILRWLDQWFSDAEEEQDWDWWESLVPSEATMTLIFYLSIALVLLLTGGIIFVEMRSVLRHRRTGYSARWQEPGAPLAEALSLEAVAQAPISEQPGLLLQWLLHQLDSLGVLQVRKSLTHRDIAAASAALAQQETVSRLCRSAELATFGGWTPTQQEMDALFAAGQEAVQSLQARGA